MNRESDPCDEGGNVHTWNQYRGLDVNVDRELVNVRHCLRCDTWQEKPYGAGSRRGWRKHRPIPFVRDDIEEVTP